MANFVIIFSLAIYCSRVAKAYCKKIEISKEIHVYFSSDFKDKITHSESWGTNWSLKNNQSNINWFMRQTWRIVFI